jgi:hypothetical protein
MIYPSSISMGGCIFGYDVTSVTSLILKEKIVTARYRLLSHWNCWEVGRIGIRMYAQRAR